MIINNSKKDRKTAKQSRKCVGERTAFQKLLAKYWFASLSSSPFVCLKVTYKLQPFQAVHF